MLKRVVLFCALLVLSLGLAAPASAAQLHKNAPVAVKATPTESAAEAPAAEAAHEEESSGLPQMDVSRFPGQLFWLAITFFLTYVLMKHVALPSVEKTLEVREKRILADIGESKAKNESAKHLMVEVETRLAKARSDAQIATRTATEEDSKKATDVLNNQTAKVTNEIKAADANIIEQKNKAIVALDKEVVGVVIALVQSVANITPSTSDIEVALKKARGV